MIDADLLASQGLLDLQPLAAGGSATTFTALQTQLGRTVAVKVIDPSERATGQASFEAECAALARLSEHANIVSVFQAGVADTGAAYLVLEWCARGSLSDRIGASGPLTAAEAAIVGLHTSSALGWAHERSFIHGDVKPSNLLVDDDGTVKLADFGLATRSDRPPTRRGGTLRFAAPEVLEGRASTSASDVFSLCRTLQDSVHRATGGEKTSMSAHDLELERIIGLGVAERPADRPDMIQLVGLFAQLADRAGVAGATGLETLAGEPFPVGRSSATATEFARVPMAGRSRVLRGAAAAIATAAVGSAIVLSSGDSGLSDGALARHMTNPSLSLGPLDGPAVLVGEASVAISGSAPPGSDVTIGLCAGRDDTWECRRLDRTEVDSDGGFEIVVTAPGDLGDRTPGSDCGPEALRPCVLVAAGVGFRLERAVTVASIDGADTTG